MPPLFFQRSEQISLKHSNGCCVSQEEHRKAYNCDQLRLFIYLTDHHIQQMIHKGLPGGGNPSREIDLREISKVYIILKTLPCKLVSWIQFRTFSRWRFYLAFARPSSKDQVCPKPKLESEQLYTILGMSIFVLQHMYQVTHGEKCEIVRARFQWFQNC